ncbi:NAD(P)/FAD-dependent oxidoreductase [Alloiococcus sp. CFN-8]|uniref:NAD(P)/FAD-dependent oxidoreductase n=1 Tax=Alloiococcus sp. CFN-8 TaxID=3416081 RepID=UPI003CF96BA6
MTIRINNLILDINEPVEELKNKAAKKLRIPIEDIKEVRIIKESIDARKKASIKFNYCIEVDSDKEEAIIRKVKDRDVVLEDRLEESSYVMGEERLHKRPVVVGTGPAGLFAALKLAREGYSPLVVERGENVDDRSKTVERFWGGGELNPESNVQFGEGGAGTFSDGKLTTRIKDKRCSYILRAMADAGAPEEITYMGKPHVGTDILKKVVASLRNEIIALGGEVRFNSKLEKINKKDGKLYSIIVNGEEIPCEVLILAIGHSSRDTYEMLYKEGVFLEEKAFAIGLRVEHPQELIDKAQYGSFAGHPRLKAADYRLTYTSPTFNRGVYSFCMCPGGVVVAAASEKNTVVSNGMSYHAREEENANSAIVVTVSSEDFPGNSPLRGMEFQRHYEALAYKLGGEDYSAPVQLLGDFLEDKTGSKLLTVKPSYKPGYRFTNLNNLLPSYVTGAMKEAFKDFDRKIKGFGDYGAVLTGIETRTSAPVRITRNEALESISISGLFPCGEGAGYAGGIISAAVDGLKVAERIIEKYSNKFIGL